MASSFLGNLSIFDHKNSEWTIFKARFTQFVKINSVKDNHKGGLLLTHLSEETYRLARDLAFSRELESLPYTEHVLLLDRHFKPKRVSFVEKAKFYGANRSPGETLGDWAARLRGLACYCDFSTALETNLLDRFVLGLGVGPERDKLFEQDPSSLTLARAIELAEQAACAKQTKSMMSTGEAVVVKEEPIYQVKYQVGRGGRAASRGSGGGGGAGSSVSSCSSCCCCS